MSGASKDLLASVVVATALMLAPLPAAAAAAPASDDAYVRDVVSRAAGHVDNGRYDKALAVLDEAERDRPHAVFIYVRATIEERRGDCTRAAALYREYLEHDVPEADAQEARDGEARCREAMGLAPIEPDTSQGGGAGSKLDPPGDPDDPPPSLGPPWYADPVGGVLVVGGVAGLGVGLGLFVQSRADERAARDASNLQTYTDRSRRAVRLNAAGITTLAIGSALLIGGIVRYALVATKGRRAGRASSARATPVPVIRF